MYVDKYICACIYFILSRERRFASARADRYAKYVYKCRVHPSLRSRPAYGREWTKGQV